jgi:hypothetical protein
MRWWSRDAHLLIRVRTAVLSGILDDDHRAVIPSRAGGDHF